MEQKFENKCNNILDKYLDCVSIDENILHPLICKHILEEYNKCVTNKFKNKIIEYSEYNNNFIKPIKPKKIRNSTISETENQDFLYIYNIKPYSSN